MSIRHEVIPFVVASVAIGVALALILKVCGVAWKPSAISGAILGCVLTAYMLYFFRDPHRTPPEDSSLIVAGADGTVMGIVELAENKYMKCECVRVSIFLSLFSVHVNRAPIAGRIKALDYVPGKRFFTFQEKSSEYNQNNSILIEGKTKCLVKQIVGPVARRVIHWLKLEQDVAMGDRIGMMKFGSRLDMYFPKGDVIILTKVGDKTAAGETVIAKMSR